MKKGSLLFRAIAKMSLPIFNAATGAAWAGGVAGFTIASGLAYNWIVLGEGPETFNWGLVATASTVALISSAGLGYVAGRTIKTNILALADELESGRLDGARNPMMLTLVEMRQFRVRVLRRMARLRRNNEILAKTAFIDSRTGLANSTAMEREIDNTIVKTRFERPGALMLLDLDQFGRVTEQYGTVIAQQLLRDAGKRIEGELATVKGQQRESLHGSKLSSLQGDVYALWMPDAKGREPVASIARSLRMAFAAPFDIDGNRISIGISGGIAMAPEEGDTRAKLLRHASLAVRQVRKEDATGFRFFTPRLTRLARGRYQLEAELRQAVENREFRPVFQPKIDFKTGRIVSAEALARWRRGNGKVISPAAFIPLAEETGLINQIGEQILEAACESAQAWMSDGHDVSVAVNVSPAQFQKGDLTQKVRDILRETRLPASRLELEITESMAVSDPAHVARVMNPLRSMGMKLAIDDFGTGHSNLAMLTQLPFDVFKIDRQFVSALDQDAHAPAIVDMILALANTLGLETVAEGVETPRQAEFLRSRGCTIAQGFLYSAGLPHGAFIDFLRSWQDNPSSAVSRRAG